MKPTSKSRMFWQLGAKPHSRDSDHAVNFQAPDSGEWFSEVPEVKGIKVQSNNMEGSFDPWGHHRINNERRNFSFTQLIFLSTYFMPSTVMIK